MKKLVLSIVAAAVLASCTTGPQDIPVGSPSGFAQEDLKAYRDYITAGEQLAYPAQADRPIAYVMLDDNDRGRNMKICRAFEGLGVEADISGFGANTGVPTYWLLTSPSVPITADMDERCGFMVDNFDYSRATMIANSAKVPQLSSAYVLAWDGTTSFYVDIDDGDINEAINWWFDIAAANPDVPGIAMQDWLGKTCGKGFMNIYRQVGDQFASSELGATAGASSSPGDVALLDAVTYSRVAIEVADGACKLIFPLFDDFI